MIRERAISYFWGRKDFKKNCSKSCPPCRISTKLNKELPANWTGSYINDIHKKEDRRNDYREVSVTNSSYGFGYIMSSNIVMTAFFKNMIVNGNIIN